MAGIFQRDEPSDRTTVFRDHHGDFGGLHLVEEGETLLLEAAGHHDPSLHLPPFCPMTMDIVHRALGGRSAGADGLDLAHGEVVDAAHGAEAVEGALQGPGGPGGRPGGGDDHVVGTVDGPDVGDVALGPGPTG